MLIASRCKIEVLRRSSTIVSRNTEVFLSNKSEITVNKTPVDQQDSFRPKGSSKDTFLRLKSSHCTMKTQRSLMKKNDT